MMDQNGRPMDQQAPPQANVNVDLAQLPSVVCHKCQGEIWAQRVRLKKLSALLSPQGKDQLVPITVLVCASCGEELMPMGA